MRCITLIAVLLCLACAPAFSAEHSLSVGGSRTDFTNEFGSRQLLTVESATALEDAKLVIGASVGEHQYGDGSSNATSASVTYYRDWSGLLSTRSRLVASSNDPVFVRRVADQDISYRGFANITLTAGIKYSEYYGSANSTAWYVAGAYYMNRVIMRYRYTRYDISDIGSAYGNLISFRLKDRFGDGYSQLWLGQGTSVQEYDWSATALPGDHRSVAVRRGQPLNDMWMLALGFGMSWHKTAATDYEGVSGAVDFAYRW